MYLKQMKALLTDLLAMNITDNNSTGFCDGEITNNMRWPKTLHGNTAITNCPSSAVGNTSIAILCFLTLLNSDRNNLMT